MPYAAVRLFPKNNIFLVVSDDFACGEVDGLSAVTIGLLFGLQHTIANKSKKKRPFPKFIHIQFSFFYSILSICWFVNQRTTSST
jgi:predicted Abi (CAAX) family protease